MLIDWFTVGAQALNFLVLVWLLKRFLYKPILDAVDAREKRIAKDIADAEGMQTEARREREEFARKNTEFDGQKAELLRQAQDEAQTERERLLDETRRAADALRSKRRNALLSEHTAMEQAIRRRTEREVFAIARKALQDLATTSLEAQMGEMFTRRLRDLDDAAKAELARAVKTASEPALVRSAFPLPEAQRKDIQAALNEVFAAQIPVRFESSPELISGIELTANGQKAGWSIGEYIRSLERGTAELLEASGTGEARPRQAGAPGDGRR